MHQGEPAKSPREYWLQRSDRLGYSADGYAEERFRAAEDRLKWWSIRPHVRGRLVLDAGCGTGRFAARLARPGRTVVGVDIVPAFLAQAAGRTKFVVRGSLDRLPFRDDAFDGLVTVAAIQHVMRPHLEVIARELLRVVSPGGEVVSAEYSPVKPVTMDTSYQRMHTLGDWLEGFAVAGATLVNVRGVRYTVHRVGGRAEKHWWWRPALVVALVLDRVLGWLDRGGRRSDIHVMVFQKRS